RNSMRYIAHKHSKEFLEDLKTIYKAPTKEVAESNLQQLDEKWSTKYPHVVCSWQVNWPELSSYFQYPVDMRKLVYTTNVIESFNSQLRKITKTKRVFNTDTGLMKLLYLVQENITKKWIGTIHFLVMFELNHLTQL
ncbi:MAG: transposase, partial [Bacteroidota bacterium]